MPSRRKKAQTFSPKQNLFSPCCSLTHSAVLARVRSAFPLSPTLSSTFSGSLCLFLWRMLCIILGMQIFQLNTKEIKQNAHSATRRDESVAQEMVGKVSKLLPRCHQSLLPCPHPHTQSNPLKLCSIFLHACASRFFFSCRILCKLWKLWLYNKTDK